MIIPILQISRQGLEKLSNLLKVTKLIIDRLGIQSWMYLNKYNTLPLYYLRRKHTAKLKPMRIYILPAYFMIAFPCHRTVWCSINICRMNESIHYIESKIFNHIKSQSHCVLCFQKQKIWCY